ncbi:MULTISPECIES: DNA-3-methyladenine glycosylase I [Prauserella salsuginis group]|uniref:DNA-3-methyladenine glycosylase I n=2 Tax=Prauserella salsuginis group TaxID=2893672 RepID=A0A839XGI5_9PSEU|nr:MULTISPECIES: DNA-3-methyladenine glycosylase I [Prauserella salsuginis group]MBB3661871.1 DNA-3-methyladenine glycosylase I [Prauserella sediminis]MCR3722753.1 DNA-3-methyladenine glycosylase I [Prauserella flava]MCR3737192.1 DNA-3-methyladenine glycosylase I [Prauserella salsuginis]
MTAGETELPAAGVEELTGPDGVARCAWGNTASDYAEYHDTEWGVPLRGETALFERLSLEAFQSGLSWLTILRKREAFRSAFAGFDPGAVAAFTDDDVARLLADARIVRNRAKVHATIGNARAIAELDTPLDDLLWSFAPDRHDRPASMADVPAVTPESTAMAKTLKKRGFTFVGPTTCYAMMQATGMVDDHVAGCHRAV